jgi:hypothetical protein
MNESTATEEALAADPTLEVDEPTPFDPSAFESDEEMAEMFAEAQRKAALKQYDNTFFEIFREQLGQSLKATEGEMTVEVADSILKAWPHLRYVDLEMYLSFRKRILQSLIDDLESTYPKKQEKLFTENVDDWRLHRKAYIELMILWTVRNNLMHKEYAGYKFNDRRKAVFHCVAADMTYITLGPDGMIQKFEFLADFDNPEFAITADETVYMMGKIRELSGE